MKKVIAISGTHGCGKSTQVYNLATHLKKQGKNVVVLNELARECPFPINREAGDDTQIWLITTQIAKELELMARYDYVITDRGLLDAYAYATLLEPQDWIYSYLFDYMVEHIEKYYKRYLVLDSYCFDYNIADGVRDTDKEFRLKVHKTLMNVIDKARINFRMIFKEEELLSCFT